MGIVHLVAILLQGAVLVASIELLRRSHDGRVWALIALQSALAAFVLDQGPDGQHLAFWFLGLAALSGITTAFLYRIYRDYRAVHVASAYHERLFEQSPEAIVLLDNEDRVLAANQQFTRLFGYLPSEAVGRRINELIVPEDRKDEGTRLTRSVARGDSVRIETIRKHRDGHPVDVSILGTPIWADGGQVAVYGIYRDITERKRAERQLQRSEDRHRTILDNIQDGYYELDRSGAFKMVNRAFCDLLGHGSGEILGRDARTFTDTTNAQRLSTLFEWVANHKRSAGMVEWEFQTGEGQRRAVEGSISPILEGDGVEGFRGIVRDVTERRDAETAVRHQWAALEAVLDGIAIFGPDGRCQFANDAYARMYGRGSPARLLGTAWTDCHSAAEEERIRQDILPSVLRTGSWRGESVGERADGTSFPQEISLSRLDNGGLAVVVRDITERKAAEQALRESEERYAMAARGANDGLFDWDLRTDTVYYSPRWKSMLGFAEDEIGSTADEWLGRVHPYDATDVRSTLDRHLADDSAAFELEYRMKCRDGSFRWVLTRGVALRDEDGTAYRFSGSQTDITERKRAEERLQHDALHDALTSLPNRALFMDRLQQSLERVRRRGEYIFAVLFLDLDRFKVINDSLGHAAGDQLLITIAHRLKQCIRPEDSVARLGGDEFVVLLDAVEGAGEATAIAQRIQDSVARAVRLDERDVFTSASIGIALSSTGYDHADEILRDADLAMYRAKALGKSRHELFDTTLHREMVDRLELESDLRRAVDEPGAFRLDYQPVFDIPSGRMVGIEALVRWEHPTRGEVLPADFVSVAEETGLIIPLGLHVLETACRDMVAWLNELPPDTDLKLHVNISSRQLQDRGFVDRIAQALRRTYLDPDRLVLEITEHVIMDDASQTTSMLEQLKTLNIELQIDDFGTGYTSLGHLHELPVDTLKVDRSFVMQIGPDGENSRIVRTIVDLAHDVGMAVVAEGVEYASQLRLLSELGCEKAQGNYLCAPLNPRNANIPGFIREHLAPSNPPGDTPHLRAIRGGAG